MLQKDVMKKLQTRSGPIAKSEAEGSAPKGIGPLFFGDLGETGEDGSAMKVCGYCKEQAEWRYKDGWGVLACAEWFTGKCEGLPLDVAPPSVTDTTPKGRGLDEDEKYNKWVKIRIREIWPREPSV